MADLNCKDCGRTVVSPPKLSPAKKSARAWQRKQDGLPSEGYMYMADSVDDSLAGKGYVLCFECASARYRAGVTS